MRFQHTKMFTRSFSVRRPNMEPVRRALKTSRKSRIGILYHTLHTEPYAKVSHVNGASHKGFQHIRAFNRNWDNQLRQFNEGLLGGNIPRSLRQAVIDEFAGSGLARKEWQRTKDIYSDQYVKFVDGVLEVQQ